MLEVIIFLAMATISSVPIISDSVCAPDGDGAQSIAAIAVRRAGRDDTDISETAMMPYQGYQLYQIERPKSAAEIRRADERAGRTAAAVTGMLRRLTTAGRRPPPGGGCGKIAGWTARSQASATG